MGKLKIEINIIGTPYKAVHLYFWITSMHIFGSNDSLGKTIQLPCDKAANAPKTEPKQWKKGTGKHPGKKYGRRLYTDENPRDTVKIKFATPTDARKTVAKVKKISKPFARKIQILTVGEQRAKVMGKKQVAAIFKKGKDAIRRTSNRKA